MPVAGGLIIGLLARYGSEMIRGHGIPEALEAILIGDSRMSPRVAVLKPLSSAISIGTGGPFGAEGPIIMTGGALGSLVAQAFHLSAAKRKTLLVAGAAAGMSAVFAAPVASILLAVELLLFEWKPRSFIPVAIAALAAAALRVPLLGGGPIFPVAAHAAPRAAALGGAFAFGLAIGACSAVITLSLYAAEDLFHRLPLHWMWWPAIGGAVVGAAGLVDPRVLGVGYGTIHDLLAGRLVGATLLGLLVAKAVAWTISLGSGTSGGVLAPLLMMGGALGALVGRLVERIAAGDPAITRHQAMPIVDEAGRLAGIITRGDLMKALRTRAPQDSTVLEAGERTLVVAYPDETVREAVVKLLRHGIGRLPVVSREDPGRLLGYLGRADIMSARMKWYRSEHARDRGWAREAPGETREAAR